MSNDKKEEQLERSGPVFDPPVYIQRYVTVRDFLYKLPRIEKVVDFGCAEGKFVKYLKKLPFVTEISCVDILESSLQQASFVSKPLAWDYVFKRHEALSIKIYQGSVLENDSRLWNYSAVTCIEIIEHLEPKNLPLLACNIFGYIRPRVAIFTTPNSEFNVLFPNLEGFRHWDHKFEWTRDEFQEWCSQVIAEFPEYTVKFLGVGDPPEESSHLGNCSQIAIFSLELSAVEREENLRSPKEIYTLIASHDYPGRSKEDINLDEST